MTHSKKYFIWAGIGAFAAAVLASGLAFYHSIVGPNSTNVWSILFGWQWIYMLAASIVVLVIAITKKDKILRRTALTVITSLAILLLSAQFVYSSRLYITGEGGPAGPDMNCLIWDEPFISGAYGSHNFNLCTFMSIPSFNKFLIDQGSGADNTDNTPTYYISLIVSEAILLSGLALGIRRQFVRP